MQSMYFFGALLLMHLSNIPIFFCLYMFQYIFWQICINNLQLTRYFNNLQVVGQVAATK